MRIDISQGNVNINIPGNYEIYGSTKDNNIIVNCEATITIDNIEINVSEKSKAALQLNSSSNLTLIIRGTNSLKSGDNYAGIQMNGKSKLTIQGEDSISTLDIESGTSGAGIGSGFGQDFYGEIIIISGNINIVATREGAGIGGGNGGNGGGSFLGSLIIQDGIISISTGFAGGSGLGGGASGHLIGYVEINGGEIDLNDGKLGLGAGIGGGYDGNLEGTVIINDGFIVANGGSGSAGIGGGIGIEYGGSLTGTVIINNGDVMVLGGEYDGDLGGSGIGGGYMGNLNGEVTLNSGNILAYGPGSANDIGAGSNGDVTGSVNIKVESINVDPTYMKLDIGQIKKINTTVILAPDVYARISDYDKVIYTSEDTSVATVDSNGFVTAVGKGETNIVVVCEADKSKSDICRIVVNEEIIDIGKIDLLIKVDKKMINQEDLDNIICYGNNPVVMDAKINSEFKENYEVVYISECEQDVNAKIIYKKIDIYLDIAYSIILFTTESCLDELKVYAMENSSNCSSVSFCVGKEEVIDINQFIIKVYPKYELDKNYSEKYYMFKISGYIGLIVH